MAKQLNTRIQHKYDTKANWDKATFAPLSGELIIYSDGAEGESSTPAIKIGDGATAVGALPFVSSGSSGNMTDTNTTYDLAASKSSTNGNVKLNLTAGGSGSGTDSITVKGQGGTTVTTDANGVVIIESSTNSSTVDTNTTYDLGASGTDNGAVKINLTAGGSGSGTDSIAINGTGGTTVTASGNTITINSSTTSGGPALSESTPKVASREGAAGSSTEASKADHVHPAQTSVDTATKLSTATAGSTNQPVYFTEGKPSAINYTIEKSVPSNAIFTDTNTAHAHSAGTGITLNGSGGTDGTTTISLDDSGVIANSYGPAANASPDYTETFDVPYITVDEKGRITYADNRTITLPASSGSEGYDDEEVRGLIATNTQNISKNSKAITDLENSISDDIWGETDSLQSDIVLLQGDVKDLQKDVTDLANRVSTLENPNPCLIEGTQILMADGTTKNIEDVREGELIKSWDIDNNTFVDVRCLTTVKTGISREWSLYVFDNNSILTIYDPHGIYCTNTRCIHVSTSWKEGQKGISSEGLETEFCGKETREDPTYHDRYVLLSENNLYFADNILCGHLPTAKLRYHIQNHIKNATEEEINLFRTEVEIYDTYKNWRTEPVYLSRTMKIRSKYRQANEIIVKNKKQLAGLDYKTIKRLQGELSDEEWQEVVAFCINCRNIINEKEEEKIQLMDQISQIRTELGVVHNSAKDCFKACYDLDMQYIKSRQTV